MYQRSSAYSGPISIPGRSALATPDGMQGRGSSQPRAGLPVVVCSALLALAGCASGPQTLGRDYVARNNPTIAAEYFDAGLREGLSDEELRSDYALASQDHERRLQDRIEWLKSSNQHHRALGSLVALYESLSCAKALDRRDAAPAELGKEWAAIASTAASELLQQVENASGRSFNKGDLEMLRTAKALLPDDEGMRRAYQRLVERYKHYLAVVVDPGSRIPGGNIAAAVARGIAAANPELLEPVASGSPKHNADLVLYLEAPDFEDTGWTLLDRRAFHKWIPRLDKDGNPIVHVVQVPPTPAEVDMARAAKQPPPGPRSVRKQVFDQVTGEVRQYQRELRVEVGFDARVRDLVRNSVPVAVGGTVEASFSARYFEYQGHPRAKEFPPGMQEGKPAESSMPNPQDLTGRALAQIPGRITPVIVGQIE